MVSSFDSFISRRKTRSINVGDIAIGSNHPIAIQSMTNTDTRHSEQTLAQITELADAGCEIIRVAVPDKAAAQSLAHICQKSPLPVIADIHFDHTLALAAIEAGVSALRINPGNIGARHHTDAVVDAAKAHNISIRIGVNGGSLDKSLIKKYGGVTAEALCESALLHVKILEERQFFNTKISIKASSVPLTVMAYRQLAKACDYPFHIGITEAGTLMRGTIKSSVGIGILLSEGLGDTLRVSLTHDPVEEVRVAWNILSSLQLRQRGPEIISCPTCGRTEIDLIGLASAVEKALSPIQENFTVAVMGCVVNGPGEAKEADVGIAGGRGKAVLFRKGQPVGSVTGSQDDFLKALLEEVDAFRASLTKNSR